MLRRAFGVASYQGLGIEGDSEDAAYWRLEEGGGFAGYQVWEWQGVVEMLVTRNGGGRMWWDCLATKNWGWEVMAGMLSSDIWEGSHWGDVDKEYKIPCE